MEFAQTCNIQTLKLGVSVGSLNHYGNSCLQPNKFRNTRFKRAFLRYEVSSTVSKWARTIFIWL